MAGDAYRSVMRLAGKHAGQPLSVSFVGDNPVYGSPVRAEDAASGVLAAVSAMAQEFGADRGLPRQSVSVDRRAVAASLLGFLHMQVDGRPILPPSMSNPTIAIYRAGCGRFIHLHGGFPHLKDGLLRLLDCTTDETAIAAAVAKWDAEALEDAIAFMKLCGGVLRTRDEWNAHPQGVAISSEPLVDIQKIGDADPLVVPASAKRPLNAVRVLDLTRVLAGPVCGRTLASHGAHVLRVGAAHLPTIEPFVMDTSHGKRLTTLDFGIREDAQTLQNLAAGSAIFVQGFRPGSLARHGFGPQDFAELRPGIIYVSVNCYGHTGPMSARAGWEQLAQSVTGMALAHSGDADLREDMPGLFPAAACDYTTGYLAAFGALAALRRQQLEGGSWHVRVSLAKTATWMQDLGARDRTKVTALSEEELSGMSETRPTPFGEMRHLRPADTLSETPPHWELPPAPPGSHEPIWNHSV